MHSFAYHWLKNPNIFLPSKGSQITNRWLGQYYLRGSEITPHLFGQALSWDLLDLDLEPNGKILQYVDNPLICSPYEKNSQPHVIQVLNFLAERGYNVSCAKAQMVVTKATYLGVQITHRSRRLPSAWVQGILQLPSPTTRKQLRAFLGLTGYCRIWIPTMVLLSRPSMKSLKGRDDSIPLLWGTPQKKAEATLKQALTQAPALRLPDPEKTLQHSVYEKEGIALGVLSERLEPQPQPVAYLSKRLDPTTWGWPPCLQNLAAIAILIEDALKLSLGGKLFLPATKWNSSYMGEAIYGRLIKESSDVK